jgi:hypothetical protein
LSFLITKFHEGISLPLTLTILGPEVGAEEEKGMR